MSDLDSIPIDELSERRHAAGWTILIAQFVIAFLVSLAVAVAVEIDDELPAAIFIGFLFVQMLLSAVGTSMAPIELFTRLIVGTSVTLFFCLCMYFCAYRDGGGHGVAIPIVGAMFAQWVLFQIPLWILRFQGWHLVAPRVQTKVDRRKEVQFGIRHLLIWTTVVAVFMGFARMLVGNLEANSLSGGTQEMIEFGAQLTLGSSLIAVPIIWGCLSRHYFWFWIFISLSVCAIVCLVQFAMYKSAADTEFVIIINATQASVAMLAMLAIRMTGYRLQRISLEA